MKQDRTFKDSKIYKIVMMGFGVISVILGVIGIFLPLLPTTPFLLLASFLFVRSSKDLNEWLLSHKVLGKFIRDYKEQGAIPRTIKKRALIMLWISIGFSIYIVDPLWLKGLLFFIASAVSIHILRLKTL